MKKALTSIFVVLLSLAVYAEDNEQRFLSARQGTGHGNALNIGVGLGYGNRWGRSSFPITANYEFELANSFTLAPMVFTDLNYGGLGIGLKGLYYFDELIGLVDDFDLYAGASVQSFINGNPWLFIHIGARYNFNEKVSIYLDLSNSMSSVGPTFRF